MIVVTGAAGFIGSCLITKLNNEGHSNLILVDDFSHEIKKNNYLGKNYLQLIERSEFLEWFNQNAKSVNLIYHIGARTDTTEFDYSIHEKLNLEYSKKIWNYCTQENIPLVTFLSHLLKPSRKMEVVFLILQAPFQRGIPE